jgi:hypothetical protein
MTTGDKQASIPVNPRVDDIDTRSVHHFLRSIPRVCVLS